MKITGAIFDMDGTLLNSMDYWAVAPHDYLKKQFIEPLPNTSQVFLEDGFAYWFKDAQARYGLTEDFEAAKRGIYEIVEGYYHSCVIVKPGALDMLEALYQKGVKMCLATATERATVEPVLKKLGIDKYFSRIFTSGEVGVGKREPRIYEVALEYLGTDKETTYVFEDAVYALRTAYTNGFKVVGVYDKNVYATEDEVKSLCHVYLDKDSLYRLDLE